MEASALGLPPMTPEPRAKRQGKLSTASLRTSASAARLQDALAAGGRAAAHATIPFSQKSRPRATAARSRGVATALAERQRPLSRGGLGSASAPSLNSLLSSNKKWDTNPFGDAGSPRRAYRLVPHRPQGERDLQMSPPRSPSRDRPASPPASPNGRSRPPTPGRPSIARPYSRASISRADSAALRPATPSRESVADGATAAGEPPPKATPAAAAETAETADTAETAEATDGTMPPLPGATSGAAANGVEAVEAAVEEDEADPLALIGFADRWRPNVEDVKVTHSSSGEAKQMRQRLSVGAAKEFRRRYPLAAPTHVNEYLARYVEGEAPLRFTISLPPSQVAAARH